MSREFTARIEMDNAAFEGTPHAELQRILEDIARKLRKGYQCAPVQDINGNHVGQWRIDE